MRLRRSVCDGPGIQRRRAGRGFTYLGPDGTRVSDPEILDRIRSLAIPPAWTDVWICTWAHGHIQALGTDDAGRRQYLYHDEWRQHQDRQKFVRSVAFGRSLPLVRKTITRDLAAGGLGQERVLAAAVRLLDLGLFRIGSDQYVTEYGTYGLSTVTRQHVSVRDGAAVFDYLGKGSIQRTVPIIDPETVEVIAALRRRRPTGTRLFAFKQDRRWVDMKADDVNAYLKEVAGPEFTAKDFRTWSATTLAGVSLARAPEATSNTARKRQVVQSIRYVADCLGNTPAVCRASYIDPRILDRYQSRTPFRLDGVDLDAGDQCSMYDYDARLAAEPSVLELLDGP
jgi:DNA topoisomerase-1